MCITSVYGVSTLPIPSCCISLDHAIGKHPRFACYPFAPDDLLGQFSWPVECFPIPRFIATFWSCAHVNAVVQGIRAPHVHWECRVRWLPSLGMATRRRQPIREISLKSVAVSDAIICAFPIIVRISAEIDGVSSSSQSLNVTAAGMLESRCPPVCAVYLVRTEDPRRVVLDT